MTWLWTVTALLLSKLVLRSEVASWRAPIGMSTQFPPLTSTGEVFNGSGFVAVRPDVGRPRHSIEEITSHNAGGEVSRRRVHSYRMSYASLVRSSGAKHIHIHIPPHVPSSWDKPPAALLDTVDLLSAQLMQLAKEIHRRSEASSMVGSRNSDYTVTQLQRWLAEYTHRFTLLPAILFVLHLPIQLAWTLTHQAVGLVSWSLRIGVRIAKWLSRGVHWSLAWATDMAGVLGQHLVVASFLYLLSIAAI